ncbi:hypothetical protein [Pelomonas cellulosilytica]|uniref:Uncharacterized protein n=1 Tax=Pelomonas cellulosilytica TaxID=2906762 RepID=A0ABS8XRY9_9BURK|nr:hypothetical protein [Pelomonas sp. P8]MCE4553606.1 hypothetical protein [Pelomonas sp. P8]
MGLLLEVRNNRAFVYAGALSRPAGSNKGWFLEGGDIEEHAINDRADDFGGNGPRVKVEVRPGSLRVCTPDSWLNTPCGAALPSAPDRPFLLTGFAVEPSRSERGVPGPRDVYLATEDTIWHWQSASQRWSNLLAPPGWRQCNGPPPR